MSTLLKTINKEIQDFQNKQIQIVPGLTFNQYDTINQIHFYYQSKFASGDIDDEGDKKYFLNINKNPCKVCTKAIDFDTKNIRLLTAGGGSPTKTWFMERDLKYWMRKNQFGKVLNRLFKELPIFGTVVLKIVNGEPEFVDLRNFVVEQSADDLDCSNYIIEIHNMTTSEFREAGKKMKWKQEDIDRTIELFHQMKDCSKIRLYERYGEVPEETSTGIKYSYKRVFYADVGVDEFDQYGNIKAEHAGIELSSDEWSEEETEKLYWEFHLEKMAGRWLGIGVVETLFEPQIRQNELVNLQSKSSYWAALRVFQSRDQSINRNLRTEVKNGEVLPVDSEITQVDMSDRNLPYFNEENQKWMANRDELVFSYDVVQGERLPAGTPLGSAQIASAQTLSYFEGIQENVAIDVKEMLYEVIIPQFQKDASSEHTIRLVGKDLDAYADMVKNEIVNGMVWDMALKGKFPTEEEKQIIEAAVVENIKQGKEKLIPLPKNVYKDAKYDLEIDITGEAVDTRVRYATRFALLQAITADPMMLQDPVKMKIAYGLAEDGGLNPADIFEFKAKKMEDIVPMQGGRAGGGVSAPALEQSLAGQSMATL